MNDTLIVGAGPVGLFLAAELKLQGHTPLIIDRLERPTGLSKALGVQGGGVALLEARGLLPLFKAEVMREGPVGLHFAGLPLDEPTAFLFVLQARVEAVLEAHLDSLGVRVQRGVALEDFEQRDDHVRVTLRAKGDVRTTEVRYLVGCDGAQSTVRTLAGIDFPGTEPTMLLRLGDVRMPGATLTSEGLLLPNGARAPFGVGVPIDDGYFRVVAREPYPPGFDRKAPFHLEELQAALRRSFGFDIPVSEPRWLSRFTNAARQAATYRKGRVLLAGDAAHIHLPAGGPGIGTGLGDAGNLAWRLSAVLGGHHPDTLLDGYHEERHPAGARVLQHTQAQSALMTPGPHLPALRGLLGELLRVPEARRFVSRRVQGLDNHYGDDPNPLVGQWMPTPIDLRRGRFVLLLPSSLAFENEWGERLEVRPGEQPLLIRPDGFVAWAGDGDIRTAVSRWLGRG
ncbi:FAD-dependent monooxygenase [Hyalangium versicolor]|uniref:FAD-dependent monooxygenase n=1 Tax=Hyalangium versicolor TaxID=2861190 RepID=UPI001CCE10FC|nr:FAD-dependent monooxygenase [Hyalangium versicolor]